MSELICALDAGTTKVCALIAEVDSAGSLRVIGAGRAPARGMRRGTVISSSEATAAIGQAIEEAESSAGTTMESAVVSISGPHIGCMESKGIVAVGRNGRRITPEDCQRALEQARNIALPHNREIINAVPRAFTVDSERGIIDPVGMFGYRLEVNATLVTGATSAVMNLVSCVKNNGVQIEDLVFGALASAEAVLTPEERQAGVVLVDVGGGTGDLVIFLESAAWHANVVAVAGDHFVRDVATTLRMPYQKADLLIKQFGHAVPERIPLDAEVRVDAFGQEGHQVVNRRLLAEVINARAEEMSELIGLEVRRSAYDGLTPAGIVLTGGVALLNGLAEVSANILDWPVRTGVPEGLEGSVADLHSPEYATAVGLLLWGFRRGTEPRNLPPTPPGSARRLLGYLKGLLPIA